MPDPTQLKPELAGQFDGELEPLDLVQLDGVKARQFLHSLARRSFVALVVEGNKIKVYCKGMDERQAQDLMMEFLSTSDGGDEDEEAAG